MEKSKKVEDVEPKDFLVKNILDLWVVNGKVEYFLKWKRCTGVDKTWKPEENLDYPELVEVFLSS